MKHGNYNKIVLAPDRLTPRDLNFELLLVIVHLYKYLYNL